MIKNSDCTIGEYTGEVFARVEIYDSHPQEDGTKVVYTRFVRYIEETITEEVEGEEEEITMEKVLDTEVISFGGITDDSQEAIEAQVLATSYGQGFIKTT